MARILIVDDDLSMRSMLSRIITRIGHQALENATLQGGLGQAQSLAVDAVLLDVQMPDGSGLEWLPRFRETPGKPEVIIITGFGDEQGAEMAIRNGAWDYIQKTETSKKVSLALQRVIQHREELDAARTPPKALKRVDIVGDSQPMADCMDLIARAAAGEMSVLITGETGTGKELFARAIHRNSPRAERRFVVVDCGALPETLVEGLLFGHQKGAYTGADQAREGLIAQADGGTLFLDEVGELPLSIQKVFLRVLQEHRFRPLGGKNERRSDFRLIAATNRELRRMADVGTFRMDLFYRLEALYIDIPPLRQRPEDLEALAAHYINRICTRYGIGIKGVAPEFMAALQGYEWPGNVRELINAIETAISLSGDGSVLLPFHLPEEIRVCLVRKTLQQRRIPSVTPPAYQIPGEGPFPPLKAVLAETERRYLESLTTFADWDMSEISRISGISRSRLYDRLRKHDIRRPGG